MEIWCAEGGGDRAQGGGGDRAQGAGGYALCAGGAESVRLYAALYTGSCRSFAGGCDEGVGDCARYDGGSEWCATCAGAMLCMLFCVLLCILEAVEGWLGLLEALEVPEVMRCVLLLCLLEGSRCRR